MSLVKQGTIEEIKFEPKRANRNFIYQGTSENLNLIFWDGRVNAAGSDRPVYSFGKTEAQKEEDWLAKARIKEKKKLKSKPAVT